MTKTKGGGKAQGQRWMVIHFWPWFEAQMSELNLRAGPSQEEMGWGKGRRPESSALTSCPLQQESAPSQFQKDSRKEREREVKGTAYCQEPTKGRHATTTHTPQPPKCSTHTARYSGGATEISRSDRVFTSLCPI